MRYSVFEQRLSTPDGVFYTAYGLRCVWQADGTVQTKEVPDVSLDPNFAQRLADRCNQGQLDPRQLEDVMTDAVLEPSAL